MLSGPTDRTGDGLLPEVERIAALLRAGRLNVALTGAGVSTESGLPDFRSNTGLWRQTDPARVASLSAFRRDPTAFYAFYQTRLAVLADAVPNAAHRALARLEALGAVHLVVTQNVDGLHLQAGSREVVEVHGNLRQARCAGCGALAPIAEMAAALQAGSTPRCKRCGGLLRPNVVLFEEFLPAAAYERAESACRQCDVLVVVGSSLEVYPVAGLPPLAARHGARVVIVNREPTPHDGLATVVLRGEAGTVLPQITGAVEALAISPGASGGGGAKEEALP
jgi:NAD-dependent deacetylase